MSMSKSDFIALADAIREHNSSCRSIVRQEPFDLDHLAVLADFCEGQNSSFKRDRWLDYINGDCGPSGGRVKKAVK
jgi:hypothetical protein